MKNKLLYAFGSEWFGMAIATLAVAQVFFLVSRYLESLTLKYLLREKGVTKDTVNVKNHVGDKLKNKHKE